MQSCNKNIFKKAQVTAINLSVDVSDKSSKFKVGQTVTFLDQWRPNVRINGIVTEVVGVLTDGTEMLRIRPVTEKGLRREFHTDSRFVEIA